MVGKEQTSTPLGSQRHVTPRHRIQRRAGSWALWKWFATVNDIELSGQGITRDEAIADAEQMIYRALDLNILRFKRD